jgi:hypothetical protein
MKHVVLSDTPTWKAWHGIKWRVNNGEKGIEVCDRWLNSFDAFVEDMGEKPDRKGWKLARIDHMKGWYKENCQWEPAGKFHHRLMPGEYALPISYNDMNETTKTTEPECDGDTLFSQLDDIEKRAESGEEDSLNRVDAFRLLKEAAQATKKALKSVYSYQ